MPNTIDIIKERVENFKNLVNKKEAILAEFNSWSDCYAQAQQLLAEAEDAYEKDKTEEKREEYENWIKETADYLKIVTEYSKKFDEINAELNQYDERTITEEAELLANQVKFDEISKKMVEIQKISKKKMKYVEPEYIIMVPNAEGRDKKIFSPLVEDYKVLVEEKRRLAKVLRKQYNSVFNKIEMNDIEEEITIEVPTEGVTEDKIEVPVQDDIKPGMTMDEKIKRLKEEVKNPNLSIEMRIRLLEELTSCCLNDQGRKMTKTVDGVKVTVPRHRFTTYQNAFLELNKLKKELNNPVPVIESSPLVNTSDSLSLSDNLVNAYNDPSYEGDLENDPVFKDLEIKETKSEKLINLYQTPYDDEILQDEKLIAGMGGQEKFDSFMKENEEKLKDEENDRLNDEVIAMVNKHHDDYVKSQQKPSGFMKILNIKKPVNKEKLKDTIKRAIIGIAGAAIVLTSAVVSSILMERNISNNNIQNDLPVDEVISEIVDEQNAEQEKYQEYKEPEVNKEVKDVVKLGDRFSVKEDANIYDTMYDATLNRNAEHHYFSATYERSIGGVAVNYEGQLYFFYSNDATAQENVDMLMANGGKITAVLAENASGYEGFYNIEDVNVLNNTLGGTSR